jgi:hypothetical protein
MMRLLMSILIKIRLDLINTILSFNIFLFNELVYYLCFLIINEDEILNEEYFDDFYRHISS